MYMDYCPQEMTPQHCQRFDIYYNILWKENFLKIKRYINLNILEMRHSMLICLSSFHKACVRFWKLKHLLWWWHRHRKTDSAFYSLFKDIKIHPLPQQSPPQHDPISVEFPWQSAPPSKGAGFLHSRILDLKQLTSQVLHSPHSVHPPSTGLFGL